MKEQNRWMYMVSSSKLIIGIIVLIVVTILGCLLIIKEQSLGGDTVAKGGLTDKIGELQAVKTTVLNLIDETQIMSKTGERYVEIPKTKDGDVEYWVNEYLAPGGAGYETVTIRTELDGTQYISQTATGPEAESRTYDWKLVEPNPHGL